MYSHSLLMSGICPGRWVFANLSSTLSRHIETLETDPAKLLSGTDAVAAALTECGDGCSHPVTEWDVEDSPAIFISTQNVAWRVILACPVPECDDELFICSYRIDAETGDILSGGLECCVDCPGFDP